jgi:hypothetical protein
MGIICVLSANSLLRMRDRAAMQWLAMGFFSLLFSVSAQAIKLLGSESQLQDGSEVAYRFENQERMVTRIVDRDEIRPIAMDWTQDFYNGGLDQVEVRSRITPIHYWLASSTRTSDHQTVCAAVLADGSIVEPVEDYTVPDKDQSKLAHLKFAKFDSDDERRAFEKLIQETEYGKKADFSPATRSVTDALDLRADSWGKDRIIKAEWIAWLCTDPKASPLVTTRGIELNGARVDGVLNLAWAKIQFPLRATACAFMEVLLLNQSSLRSLELQTSEIKGLQGDGVSVERNLVFSNGFRARGPVVLRNATIGGCFQANEGHFDRGQSSKRNGKWPDALDLENAKIAAGINLESVEVRGVVVLSNATIAGNLDCEGAHFDGIASEQDQPDNPLYAESMKVTGNAHFCRPYFEKRELFTASGEVVLRNATIEGNLDCGGGYFSGSHTSINAESVKVGADVYLRDGFRSRGTVNFRSAKIAGNLDCDNGYFYDPEDNNPPDNALCVMSAKIEGSVLLRGQFKARGTLLFLAANIGSVLELGTDKVEGKAPFTLDVREGGRSPNWKAELAHRMQASWLRFQCAR